MLHQWMFVHFKSVFLNVFCLCGVWEDSWEDKIVARECKEDRIFRETECKALQLNSFNHPFASSMETNRRIDRLCVGALLSAHSSITFALPGSSVYWWLEKDEQYEAEESVCYTNQFLTGEWTWPILAERCIECVCLLPWGPKIIMWVLLFKEQLWLLQKLYVCTAFEWIR